MNELDYNMLAAAVDTYYSNVHDRLPTEEELDHIMLKLMKVGKLPRDVREALPHVAIGVNVVTDTLIFKFTDGKGGIVNDNRMN
jgi:hypothetical protein